MKRAILIITFGLLCAYTASAQQDIDEVLFKVEQNNKELQAQRELVNAQKLEAKTGNSLNNPTVELESMWGPVGNRGNSNELTVAQAFDFPSAYAARNKIAKLKSTLYDHEGAVFRQNILLQAKQLCLDIIYLRQQKALLDQRLDNAKRLDVVYKQKLGSGNSNILEANKINIELISAQTQSNLNDVALTNSLQQLSNLAGGEDIPFLADKFPELKMLPEYTQLEALYLDQNPELKSLESELGVNQKAITLSKTMSLPQFELGYRHDFGQEGRFKGLKVGMSLPIFENKNKVKTAKAMALAADTRLQSARLTNSSVLRQLYDQAQILYKSAVSMQSVLEAQNTLSMLNKALDAGQISVIEYFTEVGVLYQSEETLLQTKRDYLQALTQIYRFEL